MPTVADFRTEFPDPPFAGLTDAKIESAIRLADKFHNVDPDAQMYCAAHLLALDAEAPTDELAPDGGAGVVASETIGPKTTRYVNQVGGSGDERKAFFGTSLYGRIFLTMEQRTARVGFGTIVG